MKNLIALFFMAAVFISSCTKEPMIEPNPSFKTSLPADKTIGVGESFWVYNKKGSAEFRAYFTGALGEVYGDPASQGKSFGTADSVSVSYGKVGEYTFVMVAASSGNQGDDYKYVADSIIINVVDKRATFVSFSLNGTGDKVAGTIDGNVITGYPVDYLGRDDYSSFVPAFSTTSAGAKVYLNEAVEANLQTSGTSVVDFSNAHVTPVIYIVKAPNGEEAVYYVKVEKVTPGDGHTMNFLQVLDGGKVEDQAVPVKVPGSDPAEYQIDLVRNNSPKASYQLKIDVSLGAKVEILTNRWADFNSATRYALANIKAIRVTAEDRVGSTEYTFKTYDKLLTSFSFAGDLNPAKPGVIDLSAKTITFELTDDYKSALSSVVPKWEGSTTEVKVDGVVQESGVTVQDFGMTAQEQQKQKTYVFSAGYTSFEYQVIVKIK